MRYSKTIICLANSRKMSGRCIAGKEVKDQHFGDWIRPVSARKTEEISEDERRYKNGESPSVLDIIQIPMIEHRPGLYQLENHLIDADLPWQRIRRASWREAIESVDLVEGDLWINGDHSKNGENDRIQGNLAYQMNNSLVLIKPNNVSIHFTEYRGKRRVRGKFDLNGRFYNLRLTDPEIERHYLKLKDGEYPIVGSLLCISLGEIFDGYAYKMIASVLTESGAQQR